MNDSRELIKEALKEAIGDRASNTAVNSILNIVERNFKYIQDKVTEGLQEVSEYSEYFEKLYKDFDEYNQDEQTSIVMIAGYKHLIEEVSKMLENPDSFLDSISKTVFGEGEE